MNDILRKCIFSSIRENKWQFKIRLTCEFLKKYFIQSINIKIGWNFSFKLRFHPQIVCFNHTELIVIHKYSRSFSIDRTLSIATALSHHAILCYLELSISFSFELRSFDELDTCGCPLDWPKLNETGHIHGTNWIFCRLSAFWAK